MNKKGIVRFTNSILRPMGVELTSTRRGQSIDPSSSYMQDSKLREVLVEELSKIAETHFSSCLKLNSQKNIDYTSEVQEFFECYSSRPLKENEGGSGFHNAFWLFLTARTLDPSLVIESGVFKGHMTWLLEQACPNADIFAFDIDLNYLEHKNGKAQFFEHDWSEYQFGDIDPERSLVFFDCHVNHAKRIIEAYDRGFKYLIFDDNPPAHILYGYKLPGFPTVNMLWKGIEEISENEVAWYSRGEEIVYQLNREEAAKAREIINVHEIYPNVGDFSRYGGFSYLAYVSM